MEHQQYSDPPETIPEESGPNFLEVSIISEIVQTIEQINSNCEGKVGQDIVNERIKQVAYAKLLCNTYKKDISYLIKAHAQLGIAYYDIEYFEQAQDHLLTAFKLNDNLSDEENLSMKEFQIKILINLSKCYLENEKYSPALQICERSLKMNQTLFGEDHISNAEIFYVISKANLKLGNNGDAVDSLNCVLTIYEQFYGPESEKVAKTLFELGNTYEQLNNVNDAIDKFNKSYTTYEKIIKDDNYEILFKIAIKLANLYSKVDGNKQAYEILCSTDEKYSEKANRPVKERFIFQKHKIKYCTILKDINLYLNEHLQLEKILNETDENRKTLARTCISIAYAYLENGNEDKCLEYLTKAEKIFVENGDDKFANEVRQRMNEIMNKQEETNNKSPEEKIDQLNQLSSPDDGFNQLAQEEKNDEELFNNEDL